MSIPQKTVNELEEAFFLFDYDKDKKITTKELGPVIRSVGLNPTQGELNEMIKEVDSMGTKGLIDVPGICRLLLKDDRYSKQSTTTQEIKDALSVFDKHGDGTISVQDFRLSLTTLGERLSDKELDEVARAVDQDGEGQVRIDNLCALLLSKGSV